MPTTKKPATVHSPNTLALWDLERETGATRVAMDLLGDKLFDLEKQMTDLETAVENLKEAIEKATKQIVEALNNRANS